MFKTLPPQWPLYTFEEEETPLGLILTIKTRDEKGQIVGASIRLSEEHLRQLKDPHEAIEGIRTDLHTDLSKRLDEKKNPFTPRELQYVRSVFQLSEFGYNPDLVERVMERLAGDE